MKSAFLAAIQAFRTQVIENRVEHAKKVVTNAGFYVSKKQPKEDKK